MKFKSTILLLLVMAFVVAVAGCAGSDNPKNESQMASTPTQTVSTPSASNQDAQWVSLMQTQSAIIQADLNAISSTQTPNAKDPFDAENLSKAGQKLVDDTNTAITENDKYTVSDTLKVAQKYWRMALQNYNSGGQFTVFGANDYKKGDTTSSSTNLEKAVKFISSANGDVVLATQSLKK
ncbi:MAG TPA: hypothetical protein VFD03_03455 [Clostridia bacterium]|nr:hypothetical protein [Clostridia bacterium]